MIQQQVMFLMMDAKSGKKLIKGCKKILGANLITLLLWGLAPFFIFKGAKYYGFREKNKNKPVADG